MSQVFETLSHAFADGGITAALQALETECRERRRYHDLFEVLKMKARHGLDLPLLHDEQTTLGEPQQTALEDALLDACREVGYALLSEGQIQDAWFYLRHVDERAKVLEALERIEVNDQNLDQMLGLLLHEGLDTSKGFQLVLQHHGTCNAITTLHNALYGRSPSDRRAAGKLLVDHVHRELLENVRAHIAREEGAAPAASRLDALIAGRDYLFADGTYHIDTSHLSATVQVASELVDTESLELARDLTHYGARLDPGLQYASDPPFEDTYASFGRFFAAQLGEQVDEAVAFFQQRAEGTDAYQEGTFPIEVFIDLLARLNRYAEAIEFSLKLLPAGTQTMGRAPSLYELSARLGKFDRYREVCRERNDMLGYLIALGK